MPYALAPQPTGVDRLSNLRVLALMPHPDDIEILCAGTLIRLASLGCELHFATMTPGDKGSVTLTSQEIATVRRAEARSSAELAGAKSYTCLEFSDLEIVFDNYSRKRVTGLLRQIEADVVFTTPPIDYMFDHEITSKLVRDACFNAPVKNYQTTPSSVPSVRIPYLFYSDPIGGHNLFGARLLPDFLIDISAQIEIKVQLLSCHDSQRAWLRKQHGMDDYIESMRRWARERGTLAGVEYAEGFRQHVGHPYPADNPLIDLVQAVPIKILGGESVIE
jgi:LmbE family N-acetylglucosaminyl deacetylase